MRFGTSTGPILSGVKSCGAKASILHLVHDMSCRLFGSDFRQCRLQARQIFDLGIDFLGEEANVGHSAFVIQEAGLHHHQKMIKAADALIFKLDLGCDLIRRAIHDNAQFTLLFKRDLAKRIIGARAHISATQTRDIGRNRRIARRIAELRL